MAAKKNTPDKADESLKKHSSETGLSLEELRIISEMLKESLVREFTASPDSAAAEGSASSQNKHNYEAEYYAPDESDYEEEEYDIESFRAHSPSENFYSANSVSECPMCGSRIGDFGHYSLEFGSNIRKRANFCGLDCLKQFIDELSFSKGF